MQPRHEALIAASLGYRLTGHATPDTIAELEADGLIVRRVDVDEDDGELRIAWTLTERGHVAALEVLEP